MIDDDYTLDEGDTMPSPWWRLPDDITLTVRYRHSHIPALPLTVFGEEFYGTSLSVYGPRYLNLWHLTRFNATTGALTAQRRAFGTLTTAWPDTFSTVLDGPQQVWLALRLTRLTDPIADTLLDVHRQTAAAPPGSHHNPH